MSNPSTAEAAGKIMPCACGWRGCAAGCRSQPRSHLMMIMAKAQRGDGRQTGKGGAQVPALSCCEQRWAQTCTANGRHPSSPETLVAEMQPDAAAAPATPPTLSKRHAANGLRAAFQSPVETQPRIPKTNVAISCGMLAMPGQTPQGDERVDQQVLRPWYGTFSFEMSPTRQITPTWPPLSPPA